MRTLHIGQEKVLEQPMDYYLLADNCGDYGESYGVQVTGGQGEEARVESVTMSQEKIMTLLHLLMVNTVTPVTLHDVVEDWVQI